MFARNLVALQKCGKYPLNPVFRRAMSHDHHGGIPGENLPFRKIIGNPGRCTLMFTLFFGSAFWVPCIAFIYWMHR